MSHIPENLFYTAEHQWLRLNDDGTATVGITDFAQETLGDIVFVDLPPMGVNLTAGAQAANVESVKSASDVYTPIAGEVVAVNTTLVDAPETANSAPYDAGWFFVLRPHNASDTANLLNATQYAAAIA